MLACIEKETVMTIRIEHANMAVRDIDATARFLQTAFPTFKVRREGNNGNSRWMHIGTQDCRDHRPDFSATLTTMAFDHSSLR